jgi:hypothetical protein
MSGGADITDVPLTRAHAVKAVKSMLATGRTLRAEGRALDPGARRELVGREALRERLVLSGMLDSVVNYQTLARAFGPLFEIAAMAGHSPVLSHPSPTVRVVRDMEAPDAVSEILCVDVAELGVQEAEVWMRRHGEDARRRGQMVFAAVARRGADLSKLVGLCDAIVLRPFVESRRSWSDATRTAWLARREPNRVDPLPAGETRGGVSMETFQETLEQAALPSADPQKRD